MRVLRPGGSTAERTAGTAGAKRVDRQRKRKDERSRGAASRGVLGARSSQVVHGGGGAAGQLDARICPHWAGRVAVRRSTSDEPPDLIGFRTAHRLQDRHCLLPSGLCHKFGTLLLGRYAHLPEHKPFVIAVADSAQRGQARLVVRLRLGMAPLVAPDVGEPEPGAALPGWSLTSPNQSASRSRFSASASSPSSVRATPTPCSACPSRWRSPTSWAITTACR